MLEDTIETGAEQGPKPVARAATAMVSAAHPSVADAMAGVLRDGGNAMDAVLTAVLLQAVVEPQMTSLAGGLSVLYYEEATGRYHYLDAELDHTREAAPVAASWEHYRAVEAALGETSGRRVGVPGVVAGVAEAADRFGSLPWSRYFEPAIAAAAEGFPMSSFLYGEMVAAAGRIAAHPSGRAEFLPDGYVPPAGSILRRPRLAATLADIVRTGPDHVYRGDWARRFVADVRRCDGTITAEDLAGYRVRTEEPLRATVSGYELVGAPPPSTGGTLIAMITQIAAALDLRSLGHYTDSVDALRSLRQAVAFAEHFTEGYIKDPAAFTVPVSALLSDPLVGALAATIAGSTRRVDPQEAHQGTGLAPRAALSTGDRHSTDTDHIVAVDAQGNAASMTHTIYGTTFGTGLVVDGIQVNSGNSFPGTGAGAGRRAVSPFPPTIVAAAGTPRLVLGSPGLAARAVALVLVNHLEYRMDMAAAIDAPRFRGAQVDQPFVVESRVPEATLSALAERYGVDVRPTLPYDWHFGAVAAVERVADGTLRGFIDPRRPGRARGL
jgi:gamma-glutamyltranspeptidase / glutathione hydrolase